MTLEDFEKELAASRAEDSGKKRDRSRDREEGRSKVQHTPELTSELSLLSTDEVLSMRNQSITDIVIAPADILLAIETTIVNPDIGISDVDTMMRIESGAGRRDALHATTMSEVVKRAG